jgi:hypothetical protein
MGVMRMAIINLPAVQSLTLSSKIPNKNIKKRKIIVGTKGKYVYYSYLFFDLDRVPGNIKILSAVLVLFKLNQFFYCSTPKFAVYPLLKQFSPCTTYANACPVDPNPELAGHFSPFTCDVAIEVDITNLFNKWTSNSLVNRGLAIMEERDAGGSDTFNCTFFGSAYCKYCALIPFIRVYFRSDPCICWLPQPVTCTEKVYPSNHK